MSVKLTRKQHTVLEYIHQYLTEYRQSPFIREIQAGCQIASYKSTIDRLNALERKGFIKRIPNKHRGIQIPRRALELAKARLDVPSGGSATAERDAAEATMQGTGWSAGPVADSDGGPPA